MRTVQKAMSVIAPNITKPIIHSTAPAAEKLVIPKPMLALTSYSMSLLNARRGAVRVSTGITSSSLVRHLHADYKVPDFSDYRRVPAKGSRSPDEASTKTFTYLIAGGSAVAGVYGAKRIVSTILGTLSPSDDVLALAKIEVKLTDIPEGQNATFKWRGKPLFIRHRTAAEIAAEQAVNVSELRHAEHDNERVQKPEWLVLLGVCTHLGCVPISNAGDYGGYYCPCHGSHYDSSGRIRKGPAPLNLEVPAYTFTDDSTVVVG